MSISTTPGRTADSPAPPAHRASARAWWRARTELGFAAGILAIAVFMTVQTLRMEVPEGAGTPGPQFFPGLVAGFLLVVGVALAISVIRSPRHTTSATSGQVSTDMLEDLGAIDHAQHASPEAGGGADPAVAGGPATDGDADPDSAPAQTHVSPDPGYVPVDYRTTGIVLAGLVGFALLLQPVGWLVTASALFWVVSHALGSKRPLFDVAVSVIVASVIQIAFSAGLGLGLPPGILEGVLPWNN
ncbi:tripartite tricarboxylate transporter TctB family protein [Dietzia sp. CH92]|uniref:tripartite tricarboxylate transporter TctB family protein n=1 Tax=Dietzia sp. CH92 TaxID=3051823 RepID=UPI0028D6267E|nr:tripartite tricarboxylate transporter TctB family protein [Dietzia sp. CH92]